MRETDPDYCEFHSQGRDSGMRMCPPTLDLTLPGWRRSHASVPTKLPNGHRAKRKAKRKAQRAARRKG